LGRVLGVAMLERVGDRLADGDVDPVAGVAVHAQPFQRVVQHHLDQLDVLEPAADRKMETIVLGHTRPRGRSLAPAARTPELTPQPRRRAGARVPRSFKAAGTMTRSWTASNRQW